MSNKPKSCATCIHSDFRKGFGGFVIINAGCYIVGNLCEKYSQYKFDGLINSERWEQEKYTKNKGY